MPTYGFPIQTHSVELRRGDEAEPATCITASVGRLFGMMLAPGERDDAKREAIATAWWKHSRPMFDAGDVRALWDADDTEALINAPALDAALAAAGGHDAYKYGVISGYIVGWCVFRAQVPNIAASASFGAALRMIEDATGPRHIRGFRASHVKQNKWPEFRPVAHLWAAYIIQRTSRRYDCARPLLAGDLDAVNDLVCSSEYIRKLAVAHRAKNARPTDTLLRDSETWKFAPSTTEPWPDMSVDHKQVAAVDLWDLRKHPFPDWSK